jgi:hypothetical protein
LTIVKGVLISREKEHNKAMAASNGQFPGLPESLMSEVEKIARAQERDVVEVVSEAVDRYVKDLQWKSLKNYGRQKARERGIKEDDVPLLIAQSRSDHGR